MAGRSNLESRLQELLSDLVSTANELRKRAPEVPGLLEQLATEIGTIARHPRALGARLDARSAWLNRKFLSAASNVVEPFLVGMGLRVESLGEEAIEVVLPGWWRNQTEGGALHVGALTTAGEFASRLYWEHHLDLGRSELTARELNSKVFGRPSGDVKVVFRMPVAQREAVFHRLRSEGSTEVVSVTAIYDQSGRLAAEVEVTWRLLRQLALGPGASN